MILDYGPQKICGIDIYLYSSILFLIDVCVDFN